MSRTYYNEHDPFAAEWLKILIVSGLIAEGDVDSRSIEDVRPNDLAGYTQCHFFAGIGGWSHALRLAGWPDSRPVWTGSCPCQPFSAAGKGIGFADERHLWPAFDWLIANCRPVTIFGEQVASPAGLAWFDTVYTDLENTGYTLGASDLCAAGIGAPHIRQRLYFRADSTRPASMRAERWGNERADTGGYGSFDNGVGSDAELPNGRAKLEALSKSHGRDGFGGSGELGERVESLDTGLQRLAGHERNWNKPGWLNESETRSIAASGATRGFWSDADWWHGRDEKFRPIGSIESHVQLLANGISDIMGSVSPSIQKEAETSLIIYGTHCKVGPGETMFDVWNTTFENAIQWSIGRQDSLPKAAILLAFLRQLQKQGGIVAKGFSLQSPQISQERMRSLRGYSQSLCASCGRGLYEQCGNQSPDPLHFLSSILAFLSHKAWGETSFTYARYAGPLAPKQINRMGKLRGYGNAIVPQVAAEFIKASEGV